jgi:two-component system response regulator DesR
MSVAVLVVDDVPEVRTLLNVAIGLDARFEVIDLCGTAKEGIEAAERGHPDVIVLDVDLPDRDGLSAIADFRSAAPEAAIVVFSGSVPLGVASAASLTDADALVRKTDGLDVLVEAMVKVTGLEDRTD